MLRTLTKPQLVAFVILLAIIAVLLLPILKEKFTSGTAAEYQPWDPDNVNVVKSSVDKLNSEGRMLNERLAKQKLYKELLINKEKNLSDITLDSNNYPSSLNSIQPYLIFRELLIQDDGIPQEDNYYDYKGDKILNAVNRKIFSEADNYVNEYTQLLSSLKLQISQYSPYFDYKYYKINIAPLLDSSKGRSSKIREFAHLPFGKAKNSFNSSKQRMLQIMSSLKDFITSHIEKDEKRGTEITLELEKQKDIFKKQNFSINQYAVIIGIPFFIIAALIMFMHGIRSNSAIAANANTGPEEFKLGLSFTLNTITVLLLILSLLILGLAKVIQENTLAALLGAIAGYILNNATDKNPAASKALSPQPQQPPQAPPPQLQPQPVPGI